jgi:hypothetical protein
VNISKLRHKLNCKRCTTEFIAKRLGAKWCSDYCKQSGRDGRKYALKYSYRLTPQEYQKLVDNQNGQCAICKEITKLVVDHNHISGEIRGLLCHLCNTGLGLFKDDSNRLKGAIKYMAKSASRRRGGMGTPKC